MRLDGARSTTRKELVGGTCATRVTRGTIDFQEGDGFGLRDEEFAKHLSSAKPSKQPSMPPFNRAAPPLAHSPLPWYNNVN